MRRDAAFAMTLAALPTEGGRLRAGLPELHALYRDLLRAAAPPNPQFERERIIAQASNPRELVFLFGLLSEGENEAALLLDLTAAVLGAEPHAPVAHLADEAWYYLRTSIDVNWQLDEGAPSLGAALAYLFIVLSERLESRRRAPPPAPFAGSAEAGRAALLRSLREQFA
jgi:hypothetical protein